MRSAKHQSSGVRSPFPLRLRGRLRALARLLSGPAVVGLLGLSLVGCSQPERPGTPPRHVLLVTVDTLRADHLSAYLYPRTTSSSSASKAEIAAGKDFSIDRLATEGVLFANAFAPRGQTFPSVASLMTGATTFEHGALDNFDTLRQDVTTLAESMSAAGFATAGFTTNRLLGPAVNADGSLGQASGIEQGFEFFAREFESEERDMDVIKAAAQWVGQHRKSDERPIFLWLHLMGPHLPYDPPAMHGRDFASLFCDPHYAGEANGSREFLDSYYASGTPLDGQDVNQVVSIYDGEIARINYILGLFFLVYSDVDNPETPNYLDETLLVFASDHGEELYQRNGYWAHSKSVYSSVLHVPLFFRHPASSTGRRIFDDIVELRDVAPTVLDWMEVERSPQMTGRSLLPVVDSYIERPFEQRAAFGHWRDAIYTVRTEDWRLVWNPDEVEPNDPPAGAYPIPKLALFDVRRDPLELHDVAAEHPKVVQELRRQTAEFFAKQPLPSESRVHIDPARREALIELGYLEEGDDESARE